MSCMEYERVAFERSLPIERRVAAAKAMHRLERLRRHVGACNDNAPSGAQREGVRHMEDKVRIVIDCGGEEHELHVGETLTKCDSLESLSYAVEVLNLDAAA